MRWNLSQRGAWVGFLAVAAWFFWFAHPGLGAWFTGDDVMNLQALHGLWEKTIARIAWGVLNPFAADYRPVGGVFYRSFWALFGFDPFPYRVACFALIVTALGLMFLIVHRHAPRMAACVAGLLIPAFHPAASDLYFNTGTIYDLLAACFFLLALWRAPSAPAWEITAYSWLALQSKEMAATLPLVLFLYFWLVAGRIRWAPVLASGAVTMLLMGIKLTAGHGLHGNDLYRPRMDPLFLLEQCARYHRDLLGLPLDTAQGWVLSFWLLLALIALTWKQRTMLFALLFWIVTLLPVCVIPARSMFVTFLPLTGLALYTAVALSRRGSAWTARVGLASIALLLGSFHHAHAPAAFAHFQQTGQESRLLARRMKQAFPTLPAHSHLLFLDDPYPAHDWILTFVIRLLYNDPSLLVDRAKDGSGEVQLPPGTIVLAFRQGQLEANPPVSGALEWEPLQLSPAVVRPGDPYSVAAGTLRGAEVDVEYSSSATGVETSGRIERWCRLDEFGRARLLTPAGQAPGVIRIRRIRGAGGKWMRTDAALEIRGRATE